MKSLILCLVVLLAPLAIAGEMPAVEDANVVIAAPNLTDAGSPLFPTAIDSVTAVGGSCAFECQQVYYQCLMQPEGNPQECREDRDLCLTTC